MQCLIKGWFKLEFYIWQSQTLRQRFIPLIILINYDPPTYKSEQAGKIIFKLLFNYALQSGT